MARRTGAIVALLGLLVLAGPSAFLLWAHSMFTVGVGPTAWLYAAVAAVIAAGVVVGLGVAFKKSV